MSALVDSFWTFVRTEQPPELGPGPRPGVMPFPVLAGRFDTWSAGTAIDPAALVRLRAIAYLHHDHADPAHDLVQDLTDADAALIHAIVHRREPDYWNAKYWFRRVEDHPVFRLLTPRVVALATTPELGLLLRQLTLSGTLDPHALVDAVEDVAKRPIGATDAVFLRQVQLTETEALVAHLLGAFPEFGIKSVSIARTDTYPKPI